MKTNNKLHFNVGKDRIVEDSEKNPHLTCLNNKRFIKPKAPALLTVIRTSQDVMTDSITFLKIHYTWL